jgi:hypothetical protein
LTTGESGAGPDIAHSRQGKPAMTVREANKKRKTLTCLRCGRTMRTDRCHRICRQCRRRHRPITIRTSPVPPSLTEALVTPSIADGDFAIFESDAEGEDADLAETLAGFDE